MANESVAREVPVRLTFRNSGEACTGALMVGEPDKRVQIPFRLNAKESSSVVVYCPTYELPADPRLGKNDNGQKFESFTDISLTAISKSGTSEEHLTMDLGHHWGGVLSISSKRNGLEYITKESPPLNGAASKSKEETILQNALANGGPISVLSPEKHIERIVGFDRYKSIYLGVGSNSISDGEVAALKEYLLNGGQIVFGANSNSAATDPRWTNIVGKPGADLDVGNGRVVNLGFDPEVSKPTTAFRYRFGDRLTRTIHAIPLTPDLSDDKRDLGSMAGPDPFKVHLPSFAQIAAVLGAYFFLVVPVNFLILRKLQKPELMWVTAPLLAVGFSTLMFRSADNLYKSPASIAVDGFVVCDDDIRNAVFTGAFDVFSPSAGTSDWNLRNTVDLDRPFQDDHGQPQPLPLLEDDGLLNGSAITVPTYHNSNLQFGEFSIREVFPNPRPIKFEIDKGKGGVNFVKATNMGKKTLKDVVLVAGEFSLKGRVLKPGRSITLAVDKIEKLPLRFLTALQDTVEGSHPVFERNLVTLQTEGRIALFGTEYDVPAGPNLVAPHSFRSKITLVCFAPCSLQLP